MRKLIITFLVAIVTVPILADDLASNGPVLCTLAHIRICTIDQQCKPRTADDLGLPRFVVVDPESKIITAVEENRQSRITSVNREEGLTILHGFENNRAWSAIISDDGDMTLTASSDGTAFAVFGACVPVSQIKGGSK